ncbi:MAG: trehalose 6-phosphate synthase [Desulfovibrionales bacterium]
MTDTVPSITDLRQFYEVMDRSAVIRRRIVRDLLAGQLPSDAARETLVDILAALEETTRGTTRAELPLNRTKTQTASLDLSYEISELRKDLVFLEQGRKGFVDHLSTLHPDFDMSVRKVTDQLHGTNWACFITDRDGTTNNYCGRYRSSVQAVWNSVYLTQFSQTTQFPVFVTSGPLSNGGILDVSVNPEGSFLYAASKGRECLDREGTLHRYPVPEDKQKLLDDLNQRLQEIVDTPECEQFGLIGSGLQFKFGQSTIARQDITESIPYEESKNFLEVIENLVRELDPEEKNFRIEDTGLDIEIILTIGDEQSGLKDFDKGDAVRYLDQKIGFRMAETGPHLVCGDTFSDIPMIQAAQALNDSTRAIFVTRKEELAGRVRALDSGIIIVPEPDVLVASLYLLSGDRQ